MLSLSLSLHDRATCCLSWHRSMARANPSQVSVIRIGNHSARLAANLIHAIPSRAMSCAKECGWRTRMWHHHPPPGRAGSILASAPTQWCIILFCMQKKTTYEDNQCTGTRCGRLSMVMSEREKSREDMERRSQGKDGNHIDFLMNIGPHSFPDAIHSQNLKLNLCSPVRLLSDCRDRDYTSETTHLALRSGIINTFLLIWGK